MPNQQQRHRSRHIDGHKHYPLHVHIQIQRDGHERLPRMRRIGSDHRCALRPIIRLDDYVPSRRSIRRQTGGALLAESTE